MVNTAVNSMCPQFISNVSSPSNFQGAYQCIVVYFGLIAGANSEYTAKMFISLKCLFVCSMSKCKAPSLPVSFVLALSQYGACTGLSTQAWCVHVCACFLLQKAVITNVSPDVLYLFRVQAVCQHDLRSDFSQTLLFRGTWSKPYRLFVFWMVCLHPAYWTCVLSSFSKYNQNIWRLSYCEDRDGEWISRNLAFSCVSVR